jgi:glyoxylate utilization-related uncharacterized protein
MSYFFAEPARHTLSITRKAHLQGNARGLESVKVTPLHAAAAGPRLSTQATETHRPGPRLMAQIVEFQPAGAAKALDNFRETSGVVYVLEGQLQLEAGGMHEVLEAGDCAYMESEMALAWSAAGKQCCRVLAVLSGAPA